MDENLPDCLDSRIFVVIVLALVYAWLGLAVVIAIRGIANTLALAFVGSTNTRMNST